MVGMKVGLVLLPVALILASPAAATQGMLCSGKGASVHMLFGHAAVSALVNAQFQVDGAAVPSAVARNWLDDKQMMIDFSDPDQMELIASLRLAWREPEWRGTLTYKGRKIALRCEEA